jgi:hypothetical protein
MALVMHIRLRLGEKEPSIVGCGDLAMSEPQVDVAQRREK